MALQVFAPRTVQPPVNHLITCEAPWMQAHAKGAIDECNALGADAMIYETCRSEELQEWYYAHGASRAATVWRSWHGYGLAVDVISRKQLWAAWSQPWWRGTVVGVFKKWGFKWGGDWIHFPDPPHFQMGACKPSPSDRAVLLYDSGGMPAVWKAVGAA